MTHETSVTSISLMRDIKQNVPQAWVVMVDLYGPLVCAWCRRARMGREDIADTTQEILLAAWAGIEGFRRERPNDTFRGWLRTIARNKICDFFERHKNHPDAEGGTAAYRRMNELPVSEELYDEVSVELAELFRRALALVETDFAEHTRRAFWMTVVEERSPSGVAKELGMTEGAVRNAKYKVLRRVRQVLGDED